jgi:hypothetical protein
LRLIRGAGLRQKAPDCIQSAASSISGFASFETAAARPPQDEEVSALEDAFVQITTSSS